MVAVAATVHTAYAVVVAFVSLYCFWIARTIAHSGQPQSATPATAMVIGACIIAVVSLSYGACAFGFWRASRWAWWLSLVVSAVAIAGMLTDTFGGDHDPENWFAIGILSIPVMSLFLPGVKHALGRARHAA
jgi:hypothetical protein